MKGVPKFFFNESGDTDDTKNLIQLLEMGLP